MANLTLSHSGNMDITGAYIADDQLYTTYGPNNTGKLTGWTYDEPAEYVCGNTYTIVGHPSFSGTVYSENFTVSGVDILGNAKRDMSVLRQDFDRNLLHRTVQKVRPNPIDGALINSTAMTENTFEVNFTITGSTYSNFILMYNFSGETGVRESSFLVSRGYTDPDTGITLATSFTLVVDSIIYDEGQASVVYEPSNATVVPAYSISDSSIATIDSSGHITALRDGEVVICARDLNSGLSDCKTVTIEKTEEILADHIEIYTECVVVDRGYPTVVVTPSYATTDLHYYINDPHMYSDVVTIDEYTGEMTVLQTGQATVWVRDALTGKKIGMLAQFVKSTPTPETATTAISLTINTDEILSSGNISVSYLYDNADVSLRYYSLAPDFLSVDEYTGEANVLKDGTVKVAVYDVISHLNTCKTIDCTKDAYPFTVYYNVTSTTEPTYIAYGPWRCNGYYDCDTPDNPHIIKAELEDGTPVPQPDYEEVPYPGWWFTFPQTGRQKVIFYSSENKIPGGMFYWNPEITPDRGRHILELDAPGIQGIGYEAFFQIIGLSAITIPDVTTIDPLAFSGTRLVHLRLPERFTSISSSSFMSIPTIKSVVVPSTVGGGVDYSYSIGSFSEINKSGENPWGPDYVMPNMRYFKFENTALPYECSPDHPMNQEDYYPPQDSLIRDRCLPYNVPIFVPCEAVAKFKTALPAYAEWIRCSTPGEEGYITGLTLSVPSVVYDYGFATAYYSPADSMAELEYYTSDSDIATIDYDGKITVVRPGEVTIYVRDIFSGYVAAKTITVAKQSYVSDFYIDVPDAVKTGDYARVYYEPADATRASFVLNTTKESIATIDTEGKITVKSGAGGFFNICAKETYTDVTKCKTVHTDNLYSFDITYNVNTTTGDTRILGVTSGITDIFYNDEQIPVATGYTFPSTGVQTLHIYSLATTDSEVNGKTVAAQLFSGCTRITSAVLDERIASLSPNMFTGCGNMKSITCTGVKKVGNQAFWSCTSLTGVTFDNVELVNTEAFRGCTHLTGVTFSKVRVIGNESFRGCTGLKQVTFPTTITAINSAAFSGCTALETVTIPDGANNTSIGGTYGSAFYNCTSLKNLYLGSGVKSLSSSQNFQNCAIERLVFPDTMTSLGAQSNFRNNTKLKVIIFGTGITDVPTSTFRDCSALEYIYATRTTPPTVHQDTFQGVKTNGTLYYSSGATGYTNTWLKTNSYYLGYYNWNGRVYTSAALDLRIQVPTPIVDFATATTITYPADATILPLYGSSNLGIASIDDNGAITVYQNGTVTFTVTDAITLATDSVTVSVSGTEKRLVVTYNVTSTSSPTKIYDDVNFADADEIFSSACLEDGTPVQVPSNPADTSSTGFTFPSTGRQKVFYTLKGTEIASPPFNTSTAIAISLPYNVTRFNWSQITGSSISEITSYAVTPPRTTSYLFSGWRISNGKLYYPSGSDYSLWMNGNTYGRGLNYYGWTSEPI